jgi:hypothetical protein
MKTYDLFPTLVATETYEHQDQFKQIFFDNLPKYLREDGITGEQSGHVDLHLNQDFEEFFRFVSGIADEYIETLVGTKETWEPWLVKTWFSDFNVPAHNHDDAHLSFVYYVNVPEAAAYPLHLLPPLDQTNDLTTGMFLGHKNVKAVEYNNQYNCNSVEFRPTEGTLLIFPAKLRHMVETHKTELHPNIKDRRISLAGDFVLTLKEKTARSMGLQPISNWRLLR